MSQGLCPSCGAAVNLTAEQTEDHCAYCRCVVTRSEAETQFAEVKASKAGGALVIAGISLANGEYERALSFYDKATEQDERSAEAWAGRGMCLLHIVMPDEDGRPRIKATEAVSSWETAIQFAADPEAMGRRAARVIAEVVSEDAGDWDEKAAPRICHYLLTWALDRDPKSEFLLQKGASYYSWEVPSVELWTKSISSSPSTTSFYAEFAANYDKFLKALRDIDPEAAREREGFFLEAQAFAQDRFKSQQKHQETIDEHWRVIQQWITEAKAAGPQEQYEAQSEKVRFLKTLPAGVLPTQLYHELYGTQQAPDKVPSAAPERETHSNSETTGMTVAPGKEHLESSPTSAPQPQKDTVSNALIRSAAPPNTQTTEEPFKPLANPPRRIPTALCAIFLGWLGIHKFMLGYTKEGIIQLIIGVLCCVGALVGLIEGIIYLTKSDEEFNKTYIQAKRAWF